MVFELCLCQWNVGIDVIMNNWTKEQFELMFQAMINRIERQAEALNNGQ